MPSSITVGLLSASAGLVLTVGTSPERSERRFAVVQAHEGTLFVVHQLKQGSVRKQRCFVDKSRSKFEPDRRHHLR